jgi:signal transduction histidine kinase
LQKRRNFGGEVLLHGAERVFGGWNPKGRAAPFLCPKFSRVQCAILTVPDQQDVDATEPVALAAVCQQALDHAQPELQEAGAQVVCRIPDDVQGPGIHAFFHSIFDNLISNAVKYRAVTRPLLIEITATTGLHQDTTIIFSDNGVGFDQEQAGDVFQLYRRLQVDKPGRGIGLYLIKNHVEAMDG